MNEFENAIVDRFGKEQVIKLESRPDDFSLLQINLQNRAEIKVIMTNGLSDYNMPVPEKFEGKNHVELYFCLPSYWDLDNPNGQWIFEWIRKMAKYIIEKQSWFGVGHTIPNGTPAIPFSPTMKQKFLFLNDPIYLKDELRPLKFASHEVHFLSIIPIFEDELDYKMGKGTYKLIQKLQSKGISELLDDYRMSALKSKWRLRRW